MRYLGLAILAFLAGVMADDWLMTTMLHDGTVPGYRCETRVAAQEVRQVP